jgi:hypothetical protein
MYNDMQMLYFNNNSVLHACGATTTTRILIYLVGWNQTSKEIVFSLAVQANLQGKLYFLKVSSKHK